MDPYRGICFPGVREKRGFYYDRKLEQDLERDNYIYIRDINDVTNESLKNIMQATGSIVLYFYPCIYPVIFFPFCA